MTRCIISVGAIAVATAVAPLGAQSLADVRKQYDAGQYQQVVGAQSSQDPRVLYLVGQAAQKASRPDEARKAYGQLAARPGSDPWHGVGGSALALLASDTAGAVQAANEAVARGGSLAEAFYQQGLALSVKQDMTAAAAAFQKATELDPGWSYAHYYAGLAYSKIKRVDLTASHFQTFLKIAPDAPEKPEVQSILKTLGAR